MRNNHFKASYTFSGTSLENSYGVDLKILQEFVKKHNFTPILIVDPDKNWGLPLDNHTALTGTVGELVNGFADITVGMYKVHTTQIVFSDRNYKVQSHTKFREMP